MNFIFFLAALVFVSGMVSGSALGCLADAQKDVIIELAAQNNISGSMLVSIFESICNYSTSQADTIAGNKLSAFSANYSGWVREYSANQTNEIVGNELEAFSVNYSGWIREQTNITQVLFLIADLVNASNRIGEIYSEVDSKIADYQRRTDTRFAQIEDTMDENKINITEELRIKQGPVQAVQPADDYSIYYIAILVVIVTVGGLIYEKVRKPARIMQQGVVMPTRKNTVYEYRKKAQERFAKQFGRKDDTSEGEGNRILPDKRKGK